jgi:hypothetical protein
MDHDHTVSENRCPTKAAPARQASKSDQERPTNVLRSLWRWRLMSHIYIHIFHPCLCLKQDQNSQSHILFHCISIFIFRFDSALICYLFQGYQAKKTEESDPKLSFHANWWTMGPTEIICCVYKEHMTRMHLHTGRMVSNRKKNLQRRWRFNVMIPFQLGRSLSYKLPAA